VPEPHHFHFITCAQTHVTVPNTGQTRTEAEEQSWQALDTTLCHLCSSKVELGDFEIYDEPAALDSPPPPVREVTTATGVTVKLSDNDGDTVVLLDHPDAPADTRPTEAGRIRDGGFQPVPFAPWAVGPATLRAIADLIEAANHG
jgi:hypothetical protein